MNKKMYICKELPTGSVEHKHKNGRRDSKKADVV